MKKVYVLFQTDEFESIISRVFCGVFTTKKAMNEAVKKEKLVYEGAKVDYEIIELNSIIDNMKNWE